MRVKRTVKSKTKILVPLIIFAFFLSFVAVVIAVATLGSGVSLRQDTILKVPSKNAQLRVAEDIDVDKIEVRSDSIVLTASSASDFDLLCDGDIFASVRGKNLQSSDPAFQVSYDGATGVLSFVPPSGQHDLTVDMGDVQPTVDIKANDSDGPITIDYNSAANLSWTSTNADSCTASGGWSGSKPTSGSESTGNLTSSKTYTLTCEGQGKTDDDSVTVNVSPPTCNRANPTVNLTPSSKSGTAGTGLGYIFSVKNNDNSPCSNSTFSLSKTIPSGWSATFSPSSLSLAPGGTKTSTFTVTSSSTASTGNHTVTAKATNSSATNYNASDSSTYVVTQAPDEEKPSTPTGLKTTSVAYNKVSLSWNASTDNVGVAGYDVFRSDKKIGSTTKTSYTDSTVSAKTTYYYQVRTYDAAGNKSSLTSKLKVTTPAKPVTYNKADLNKDGKVNIFDLSILLSNWGKSGGVADLNGSGKVDIFDLSILLSNWEK